MATSALSYWTTLKALDDPYVRIVGISDNAQRILYQSQSNGGYYVFDRSSGSDRRVDTFFDGTPLSTNVLKAAISGDGSTVVLLLNPDDHYEPTLRIVRLDSGENFEVQMPDAGQQTWSSGLVEHCSVLTRLGELHLDDDGNVAWLTSSPCFYDKVLALDISSSTLHWRFISAFRDNTEEVTADGRSFALGGDFYYDYNWNEHVDPGEPTFTWLFVFPVEFFDNDAEPGNSILNWPTSYPVCDLPSGARGRVDGAANRMVFSIDKVGLDPNTIVYSPGQQLYWAGRGCQLHSLGGTTATMLSQFRFSIDGRSVLHETDSGATRTELATGASTSFSGLSVSAADPLLLAAATIQTQSDPGSGAPLGSLLQMAQLSGTPSALKVAIVGDSYISGEGSFGYMGGTDVHGPAGVENLCHRSVSSWAYQLGQRLAAFRLNSAHPQMKSFACSGAKTENIEHGQYTEPSQIDQLRSYNGDGGRPVDVVFASAGGNNAGFKSIIETCMAIKCLDPGWERSRLRAAEDAASDVEVTLEHIKAAAPHATVFLTGYPSIVDPPDGDCADLGLTTAEQVLLHYSLYAGALVDAAGGFRIDRHEQAWLNGTLLPALNHDLSRAAAEAGVRWIDPSGWFRSHGVCSDSPYGNGLAAGNDFPGPKPFLGNESFHPNPEGYTEMAARIEFGFSVDFGADNNPSPIPQGIHHDQSSSETGAMVINGQMQAWGDSGNVTIQGAPVGSAVVLGMYSSPTLLGSGTVGPDGTVELPYQVPAGIYPGLHTLVAYDKESGEPLATTMTAISPPEDCLDKAGDIDRDGDDLADRCDASFADGPQADDDGDGIENVADDCPADPDPEQIDADENGIGDACDPALGYNAAAELETFPEVSLPRPAPKIAVLSQPQGYTSSHAAKIVFSVVDEDSSAMGLSVSCAVDGVALSRCSSPLELSGLDEGFHRLELSATNSNGSTATQVIWWVDTIPPALSVTLPSDGQHFVYRSSVTPIVNCDANGSALRSCSWSGLDTFTLGPHDFTATATDPAGNVAHKDVPYFVDPPVSSRGRPAEEVEEGRARPGQAIVSLISARRGAVVISLRCPVGSADCAGVTATLSAVDRAQKTRTRQRVAPVIIGRAAIDVLAGQSARLWLPLNRKGRSLCGRTGHPKAQAVVKQGGVRLGRKQVRPVCARRRTQSLTQAGFDRNPSHPLRRIIVRAIPLTLLEEGDVALLTSIRLGVDQSLRETWSGSYGLVGC